MKVQLSVCAKDLPNAANVFATVSLDTIEVGKTDVEENSADPCWNKMVVFDYEEGSPGKLSIEICKEVDKSQVGTATFEVATILGNGMAKSISNCGIIAAYIEEYVPSGTVKLKVHGKKLTNVRKGILNKSDPYFELEGSQNEIVYRSEPKYNDLNPDWPEAEIDINALCGGDLDASIRLGVYDPDKSGKVNLMGEIKISVNGLLCADASDLRMIKEGKQTGQLFVDIAELVDLDHVTDKARVEMEAAVMVQDAKQTAEEKKKAIKIAQEEAVAAKALVEEKIKAAQIAAEETEEANKKSEELREVADKVAESAKTSGCSGTFRLKLRAQDLPDTDGFFSLTDASFELFGTRGQVVYCSEVVKNNLNPEWAVAEVDVGALTGGKLDLPVRGEIYDYDKDKKGKYIGKFQMSVNEYLRATRKDAIPIKEGGQEAQGSIFVELAELVDYKDLEEESKLLRKEAGESRLLFYQSRYESNTAREEARRAELAVIAAEEKVEAAKAAAESAREAVKSAEDEAEALKKKFEETAANRPKTLRHLTEIKPERDYKFGDITKRIVAKGKKKAGREGDKYKFGDFTRGLIG